MLCIDVCINHIVNSMSLLFQSRLCWSRLILLTLYIASSFRHYLWSLVSTMSRAGKCPHPKQDLSQGASCPDVPYVTPALGSVYEFGQRCACKPVRGAMRACEGLYVPHCVCVCTFIHVHICVTWAHVYLCACSVFCRVGGWGGGECLIFLDRQFCGSVPLGVRHSCTSWYSL